VRDRGSGVPSSSAAFPHARQVEPALETAVPVQVEAQSIGHLRLRQRAVEIRVELIILQQNQRVKLIVEPGHLYRRDCAIIIRHQRDAGVDEDVRVGRGRLHRQPQ
jgi:hypothetical protein